MPLFFCFLHDRDLDFANGYIWLVHFFCTADRPVVVGCRRTSCAARDFTYYNSKLGMIGEGPPL